ncbi:MAG: hypothetical protein ACSHX0_03860 [Akkermansiaceae bacterium]
MKFIYLILSLICILLHSCIDGEEEVFLYQDGSGRARAEYRVPAILLTDVEGKALEESIRRGVEGSPHLKLVTNQVTLEKGYRVIQIEVESDNVQKLKVDDDSEVDHSSSLLLTIIGDIELDMQGLSASIERRVDLGPLLHKQFGSANFDALGDSIFRYTIHLPKAAAESNAHLISNAGKTLQWSYVLADVENQPILLKLVAPVPLPWWFYLCAAVTTLFLVLIIIRVVMKRKKGESSPLTQ